jgi:hypothetical protein
MDGWMDGSMCANLVLERFVGFYSYSVLNSLSVTGRCPMNMNSLAPKRLILQVSPPKQNGDFLENTSTSFDQMPAICGDYRPK